MQCIICCYRQKIMTVQPSDIIIVNIEEVSNGLQITFYVQTQSGVVVSANTVQSAINVSKPTFFIEFYSNCCIIGRNKE